MNAASGPGPSWWRPLALGLGGLLLVALVAFLGVRAYQDWHALLQPPPVRLQNSRLAPWMTVRFVAVSRRVPVAALAAELGADDTRVTLEDLARQRGVTVDQQLADTRRAVEALRAGTPAPAPAPRGGTPVPPGRGP